MAVQAFCSLPLDVLIPDTSLRLFLFASVELDGSFHVCVMPSFATLHDAGLILQFKCVLLQHRNQFAWRHTWIKANLRDLLWD